MESDISLHLPSGSAAPSGSLRAKEALGSGDFVPGAGGGGGARFWGDCGGGRSRKTSLLLGALDEVPAYIPIDIAAESLKEAAEWLSGQHGGRPTPPPLAARP